MTNSANSAEYLEQERKLNAAIAELSAAIINPAITLNEICQSILDKARLITESEHGFVSSMDQTTSAHISNTLTEMLKERCSVTASFYALPEGPERLYHGLWGHSLNTGKAFYSNVPMSHPASRGLPGGHVPIHNFLAVPVLFGGQLLGQIALANSCRDYHEDDLKLIGRLGELYAVVLHNRLQAQELRQSEERFRLMVESAPLPLVITSLADGTVVYINQYAEELFEITLATAAGQKAAGYYADSKERQELIDEAVQKGRIMNRELQMKTAKGRLFWANYSGTKVEWFGDTVIMAAINDMSERKRMEEELHRLATTDALTGLINRRWFWQLGDQEIRRSILAGRSLALVVIDIDYFKAVNDTYGHQAGDQVLQRLARTIDGRLRSGDVLGRIGGEEFGLVLPETTAAEGAVLAERIRLGIESLAIEFEGITLKVTASFGISELKGDAALDPIFKRADDALYEAKAAGRNRIAER